MFPSSDTPASRTAWSDVARRALDAFVAFATLADEDDEPFEPFHPHARALKRVSTTPARRPGTSRPRPQACLSPLDRPRPRTAAARRATPERRV